MKSLKTACMIMDLENKFYLMRNRKYLIIGKNSGISKALQVRLSRIGSKVITTSHVDSCADYILGFGEDRCNLPIIEGYFDAILIFASAPSIKDALNQNSEDINVHSRSRIVKAYASQCQLFLELSSTHVFDGYRNTYSQEDTICPITQLGIQKSQAEEYILESGKGCIIRTTKVVTGEFKRFEEWHSKLKSNGNIEVLDNLMVSLVFEDDIVSAILMVLMYRQKGVFHFAGKEQSSYYTIACILAKLMDKATSLVKPIRPLLSKEIVRGGNALLATSSFFTDKGLAPKSNYDVLSKWYMMNKAKLSL